MRHLSRDLENRELQAKAMLHPDLFNPAHLRARRDWLKAGGPGNFSRFERTHGHGAWSRLVLAYEYAIWRLENERRIDPDDHEILMAHVSIPRFMGSIEDDDVDFETPRRRLTSALQAPLNMKGTPRDPNGAQTEKMAA